MKIGFYESDITPPLGCFMWGYGEERLAEDVNDKLFAKAAVIENNGVYAVVISVDVCMYPPEMNEIVTKRIFEYTGIKPESVSISATHTHNGAPVYDDPVINCYGDDTYKDVFFRLVADSAILAFKRLKETKLYFGKTVVEGIAKCRDFRLKDGTLKTWAYGASVDAISTPDEELPVLFAEINGVMVGAIYTFACHQDAVLGSPNVYSGDYSSQVAKRLKEKYGSDFISIYLPAPCGDINDIDPFFKDFDNDRLGHRKIGDIIAQAIISTESDLREISGKLTNIKEEIRISRRKYSDEGIWNMLSKYIGNKESFLRINWLVYYNAACRTDYADVYVQVISIGDFAIYIYPGEMFVEYSHRTKKNSPFTFNMVVENSNAEVGYVPTLEAFAENSDLYEASPTYSSSLIPEAGNILCDKAIEIAKRGYHGNEV